GANDCAARTSWLRAAPQSAATCQCRPRQRATPYDLHRFLLLTSASAVVRVLLRGRPEPSGQSHATPQSGLLPGLVAICCNGCGDCELSRSAVHPAEWETSD